MSNTSPAEISSEIKPSQRVPAPPPKASYEDRWKYVKGIIDDFLYGRPVDTKEYMSGYDAIFNACTSMVLKDSRVLGRIQLYKDIHEYFIEYLETTVRPVFSSHTGTNLIRIYLEQRNEFERSLKRILRLLRYLDRNIRPSDFLLDLSQTISLEWRRVIFDPLMSTEGRLNDVLRQQVERAIDGGDTESQCLILDMINSLFALMLCIVEPVMKRPKLDEDKPTKHELAVLHLKTQINKAVDEHIETLSLDPSGSIVWPYTNESTSLDVLAVYLNKVTALPPPLSSVMLSWEDLKDCEDKIRQTVLDRK